MRPEKKDPHQLELERKEMEQLRSDILTITAKVPPKLLSGGSVNLVRQYKKAAAKAIAAANQATASLGKLRSTYTEIRSFY